MFNLSRIVYPAVISARRDFYDRRDEIDTVWPLLLNQSCLGPIILLGERRSGKTSLLRLLIDRLETETANSLASVLIPYEGVATASELIYWMLNAVRNYLAKQSGGTNVLRNLPPVEDTSVQGAIEALRALLALVPGRKMVLCIDEFDSILNSARRLGDAAETNRVLSLVVALTEATNLPVQLLLTAVHLPDSLEGTRASALSARAKTVPLRCFPRTDMDLMAREIAGEEHLLTDDDLTELYSLSGGWPYFAKLLLYHLSELSSAPGQIQAALAKALTDIGAEATIADIYQTHYSAEEKRLILLLASHGGRLAGSEVGALDASLRAAAKSLKQRGYLAPQDDDGYDFQIGFLAHWFPKWTRYELELERQGVNRWRMTLDQMNDLADPFAGSVPTISKRKLSGGITQ